MINWELFRKGIKSNYKFTLIFFAILTMYITIMTGMYNPDAISVMDEFYKSMPEVMSFVGMDTTATTLLGFLISYLYGFLFLLIPIIVTVAVSHSLVAAHVDRGSMAYLLASPNSRKKIIFTQIKVLGTIIFSLIAYCTLATIVACEIMQPGKLAIGDLLIINLGLLILHLFIGSICFLVSSTVNDSKYSLMFGIGIPITFFLIQMLSNMGGKLENFKYFTFFSLYQPLELINKNTNAFLMLLIMFVAAIILYFLSYIIFNKRDLSV